MHINSSKDTLIEIGIMIEQRSSKCSGMTIKLYQGPSFGYCTYYLFRALEAFQTFPATPRITTTTNWNKNIAPVNLLIIASTPFCITEYMVTRDEKLNSQEAEMVD